MWRGKYYKNSLMCEGRVKGELGDEKCFEFERRKQVEKMKI